MRRPNSVLGLLWRWLRIRRARTIAALATVLALSSLCALPRGCSRCALDREPWSAGLHEHDFLQTITFGRGGHGSYVYGYAQAVRFEVTFRYRVLKDDRIELRRFVEIDHEGRRRRLGWPPQTIDYRLDTGRYCFEPDGERRCFGCRMILGTNRLPGSYDDYYACPEE